MNYNDDWAVCLLFKIVKWTGAVFAVLFLAIFVWLLFTDGLV